MPKVTTGLDRLLRAGPGLVGLDEGCRIGLVAHPSSIDVEARHAVERLHDSKRFRLERLLAPEHGLYGQEQDMEQVDRVTDTLTGLPVISLYGTEPTSLAPAPEDLLGLDAIVFDLQDVGSRYYTFVYTLSFVMEVARDTGVPVVVLDRPNPIGGVDVEGPVLEPALASFVGRYPIPVRHGMTTGELAALFNTAFEIGCDLRVVPMDGWRRTMHFDDTGLPWVPPSPNMPTARTALVYPGGCLIEGTNLSEGRGTTTPFELVGAPWIDAEALAGVLREQALDGALFRPARFRPMFQKHSGRPCGGVQVLVEDAATFRPFRTYLAIIGAARDLDRDAFDWRTETYEFERDRLAIDLLLGVGGLRPMLEDGATVDELERTWSVALDRFMDLRREFLVYS